MREIFADAWFFIALANPFDSHHAAAIRLHVRPQRFVTHDAVLTEVLAHFSKAGARGRQEAARMARRALRELYVEPVSRELFLLALDLYSRRPDKAYSLVDCMSMVLMRQRGIEHVLTNDHHFRQEGFTVVNQ
ncbi:MAG TPA: PIN domain-containing protein [Thermoanaerobaculia bacterium]|nr:PIN domain-containing protein [Thermoanaerobaculia bacterium]